MAATTSYSETKTYGDCKREHFYSYIEKIEPVTTKASLNDGNIGHFVLAWYYSQRMQGNDHDTALAAARAAFDDSGYKHDEATKRADLELMLFGYYFPNEPYVSRGYTVLAVEKEFDLLWNDDTEGYKFIIDLIMRDPQGRIVIVDHKFTTRFTTQEMALLLPQLPLYMAGIRGKGLPVDYAEYNEINMTLVKTKRKVEEAMRIIPVTPNKERIRQTFIQQVQIATDIREVKKLSIEEAKEKSYRSINKIACNMCSFKSICIGELSGSNTALIRRTDYQPKTGRQTA